MTTHTHEGDLWRERLRRPDGTLSPRIDEETERAFWKQRSAVPFPKDAYAVSVYRALKDIAKDHDIRSVLEIGPGWGNYTHSLCRDFDAVTAVDISPDNLSALKRSVESEGLKLNTVCSPWESAAVPRCDLIFAYNCFYRMPEPELFLRKIDSTANKLCVIGMNRPPELPWLPAMEKAGLSIHYTRQGCDELREILTSIGIDARLHDIPNRRVYRYENEEALLRRARGFLMREADDDALLELLIPYHERQSDGSLVCEYEFFSQLLSWEKTE